MRGWAARHRLALLLALALGLRLAYGLALDPLAAYATGGDSGWYLLNGYALVTGFEQGYLTLPGLPDVGLPVALSSMPTPPLYLIFVGLWGALLPPAAAVIAIRIVQAALGAAVCWFGFRLARAVGGDETAGLVTAAALAVSPAFVIEAAATQSETLYIFLVSAGLWSYTRALAAQSMPRRWLALSAALLGLAALTRAALLLFPLGLAAHLLLAGGWRRGLERAALLLLVYGLVVSTWTVYNLARWNRLVIGGEGFAAFLYLGAADWDGPDAVDRSLAETAGTDVPGDTSAQQPLYQDAAARLIGQDWGGYLRRRVSELAGAYLQPHGTIYFGGQSLKDLASGWLRDDRTPGGLLRLTTGDWFWPKLAIYGFHYAALLAGLAGMWISRRQWRASLPLIGFVAYTSLVHLVLYALPRYVFPTLVVWWVFAGVAAAAWLAALRRKHKAPAHP